MPAIDMEIMVTSVIVVIGFIAALIMRRRHLRQLADKKDALKSKLVSSMLQELESMRREGASLDQMNEDIKNRLVENALAVIGLPPINGSIRCDSISAIWAH